MKLLCARGPLKDYIDGLWERSRALDIDMQMLHQKVGDDNNNYHLVRKIIKTSICLGGYIGNRASLSPLSVFFRAAYQIWYAFKIESFWNEGLVWFMYLTSILNTYELAVAKFEIT